MGKSWVSKQLATTWGIQHTQLDSLKLRPIRQIASLDEFRSALESVLRQDSWLLDGNWDDDVDANQAGDYPRLVGTSVGCVCSRRRRLGV